MRRAFACLAALLLCIDATVGVAMMASTTTTTTHTHARSTTTATVTETTTATTTDSALGVRAYAVLAVLLATAASVAVVGGYVWGKRRARRALLRASG